MNINFCVKDISMHSDCNMEILEYHSVMRKSWTHIPVKSQNVSFSYGLPKYWYFKLESLAVKIDPAVYLPAFPF